MCTPAAACGAGGAGQADQVLIADLGLALEIGGEFGHGIIHTKQPRRCRESRRRTRVLAPAAAYTASGNDTTTLADEDALLSSMPRGKRKSPGASADHGWRKSIIHIQIFRSQSHYDLSLARRPSC